jgi:hypothetical protein
MTVEQFFPLFLKELESQPSLWSYYKFHQDSSSFDFRKAYFCQRLEYISRAITRRESITWDVGCGYGTTAIFLALNGFRVHGTTLEFYYKELPQRMAYWSGIGDVDDLTASLPPVTKPSLTGPLSEMESSKDSRSTVAVLPACA